MKRKVIVIYAIILVLINNTQVKASDYASEWLAKKQAQQEKYMKELEKDGNLTEKAIESAKLNKKDYKESSKKKEENKKSNKEKYTIVYGTDELHVIGLPTDERGYTQAGKYEK